MMTSGLRASVLMMLWMAAGAAPARAQVTREQIPGITNFARVETTVACAGAVKPEAIADLKRLGFASVINLRLATEPGVDIDAEAAAAKAAGMAFVHIPVSTQSPDPATVDLFLRAVTTPANEPAFIHCASGNRAAAFWMIKRIQVDGWSEAKAGEEATALGLSSSPLRQFALDYVHSHKP